MKIVLLSSYTVEPLQREIEEILIKDNIKTEWYIAPFNQYRQEIIDSNSISKNFNPDIILLSVDLDEDLSIKNEFLELIKSSSVLYSSSTIFVFNATRLKSTPMQLLEWNIQDSISQKITDLNLRLSEVCHNLNNVFIINIDGLVHKYGYENIFDARYYYIGKIIYSSFGNKKVSEFVSQYIKSYLGKRKKCLVLDLDNTLWGGVLGEVGLENIKLSNDGEGKTFYDFQKEILEFYNSGIILAICSKNDIELVMEVFEKHPYMVLRKEHFAAYQINWNSKIQNLKLIAEEINIGLDSLVFIDDSSFERESVRSALPEISVPDVPVDFSDYPRFISEIPFFETYKITSEDKIRGKMYAEEKIRTELKETSASLKDFLFSLNLIITITAANEFTIPRISQLSQKTNQFNLTTRRYTENEIKKLSKLSKWKIYSVSATDRLGDSGIVGIAMIEINENCARIDNFLISCRVLGRGIEQAFLAEILKLLKESNIENVTGEFLPTSKNKVAKDFLSTFGFIKKGSLFSFDISQKIICPEWVKVKHED